MPTEPGLRPAPEVDGEAFRLGVNYWPAEHAMDWLAEYDPSVTRRDFDRAAAYAGGMGYTEVATFASRTRRMVPLA